MQGSFLTHTGFISLLLPGNRDVARDVRGEGADCSHYGKASLSAFSIELRNPWNKIGFMNRKREYDTERVKEKENAKKGRERGK